MHLKHLKKNLLTGIILIYTTKTLNENIIKNNLLKFL